MSRLLISLAAVTALLIAAAMTLLPRLDAIAGVGASYKAKIACSEIFLAQRPEKAVVEGEFKRH